MQTPLVGIGLPVYNGADYLAETIESLLGQTYGNFELLISDNASTDHTARIALGYAKRFSRIHFHRFERNVGATANFNFVFERSSGPYFKWAAHDDLCEPTLLARCVEALESDPEVVLAYTGARIIQHAGTEIDPGDHFDQSATFSSTDWRRRLHEVICCRHRGIPFYGLIRRQVLMQVGPLPSYSDADRILLGRLVLTGRFHRVPERLFKSRVHEKASARLFSKPAEWRQFWDPQHRSQLLLLPHWRVLWEYLALVRNGIPRFSARLEGYKEVILSLRVRWWRRKLLDDLRRQAYDWWQALRPNRRRASRAAR